MKNLLTFMELDLKMNFLVHYPAQMKAVSPMVRTWTIRHEAKFNFFKQAAHIANFKNIAFSLVATKGGCAFN